jgi:8-oxo-dGTP pyrophosphatase MutT (NUDIX family)
MSELTYGVIAFRRRAGVLEFLLIKKSRGGWWALPKGHPEEGETPQAAAIRETFEETGLQVRIVSKFRKSISFPLPNKRRKIVTFFLGKKVSGRLHSRDHEVAATGWFAFDRASQLIRHHEMREALRSAHESLTSSRNRRASSRAPRRA